ncbi:unnamed protein product, partial [marine sediment metagenome]
MLIVNDKWLVLGPNRHGTTYTKNVLSDAFPGRVDSSMFERKHNPLCKIPESVRAALIVVGVIRSPLRWYVSKWRRFWDEAPPEKKYGFHTYFSRHWNNPHGPIGKNMEDLPLSPAGIGGWSYKHLAYHCLDARRALAELRTQEELTRAYPQLMLPVDELLCTETLRQDLPRVFGDAVRPHLNQSTHAS